MGRVPSGVVQHGRLGLAYNEIRGSLVSAVTEYRYRVLHWESSGLDSALPIYGAHVQFIVGELDPTCHT